MNEDDLDLTGMQCRWDKIKPPENYDEVVSLLVMVKKGINQAATFKKVIDKQPDWTFSRYALGSAYFFSGDYDNAEKAFRGAIDKDPNYVEALYSLGIVYVKRKNVKEANKVLDQLKAKDPAAAARLAQEIRLAKFK